MPGPLAGTRVLELASLAPAPFACMVLADLEADVLRVDRPGQSAAADEPLQRGRRAVEADLKSDEGRELVLELAAHADVFVEGFRPGVTERLGLGPDECEARNPRLVYARMTGWGQTGPLAPDVGHDINYIAVAGALYPIGPFDRPPAPPLNLVGDYGGGGMLLAVGILAALHERARSGQGQVVDAAMFDGAALLTASLHGMRAAGAWTDERGANLLDGGAPFYATYETSDGRFMSVGALEGRFYDRLLEGLGLRSANLPRRMDKNGWPQLRAAFAETFRTRTRDEWTEVFASLDACVAPVLTPTEAPAAEHARARNVFVELDGVTQPAPAPRFSRTPGRAAGTHRVSPAEARRAWSTTLAGDR